MKLKLPRNETLLRVAAIAALVALVLMCWGLFDPRALPIIVSLSVGQGVGTLSFLLFLIVMLRDLKRKPPDGEA